MSLRLFNTFVVVGISLLICESAQAQPEVLTIQGTLPRLNYSDDNDNLLWSLPGNPVLWKIDGPINAGVVVLTAAAPSNSLMLNAGGVAIRGTGFPSAKLHVGTLTSSTEPGEVRVDPGNSTAPATIYAVNKAISTTMTLETLATSGSAVLRLKTAGSAFSHTVLTNYAIRDTVNAVNPFIIVPSNKNTNSIVIKNGNIGLGVVNPTAPLVLANGASCSAGGVWTNASSRELKEDIQSLTAESALAALQSLEPVTYHYKKEPSEQQVGFIAEDVPELVASNSRKELSPMDIVAVLTKVVQEQQSQLDEQAQQLKRQADLLSKQAAVLQELCKKIAPEQEQN